MTKTIFHEEDGDLFNLYIDMVFVEILSPILFSCMNDDGRMYICTLVRSNEILTDWLIAETSPELLIAMLNSSITIRDIFTLSKRFWRRILYSTGEIVTYRLYCSSNELEDLLPSQGAIMNADPGEFDKEIKLLCHRILGDSWRFEDDF